MNAANRISVIDFDTDLGGHFLFEMFYQIGKECGVRLRARDQTAAEFEQSVRERYGAHADRLLALYPHASDAEAAQSAHTLIRDAYMASTYRAKAGNR